MEEYLSIDALAKRLELSPKTIKNKMAKGVFRLGVHYFRPPGLGPRFKWSAIVQWLEQPQVEPQVDTIPKPVHYRLRENNQLNPLHPQAACANGNGRRESYHEEEGAK